MSSLAQKFTLLIANEMNAFTIREIFISLGTPSVGCDFVISFNDGSQSSLTWVIVADNNIDDVMQHRSSPAHLWREVIKV